MKHNVHVVKLDTVKQLEAEMAHLGADHLGIKLMLPKGDFILLKVQSVSLKAANIIKQEMLSKGGEAVLHKEVSMLAKELSDVLLMGTKKQYLELIKKLKIQPFGLKTLANEIEIALELKNKGREKRILEGENHKSISIGDRTLIMGILNITPDSFSDGGQYINVGLAIEKAEQMIKDGADIVDVGGESTRPGHQPVGVKEELSRVIPVIKELANKIDVPISIDTYKAEVAEEAIKAGASIINDVWGFKKDPLIAKVAARYNVPVILMHNREEANYSYLMDEVISDLRESIHIAITSGVDESKIILDPGIGFGKTYEDNLLVMNRLDEITALGYPVLLGTSRKSMIGLALDLPVTERVEGTASTVAIGIVKGCQIVRVHDVKEMKRVATMTDAIVYLQK